MVSVDAPDLRGIAAALKTHAPDAVPIMRAHLRTVANESMVPAGAPPPQASDSKRSRWNAPDCSAAGPSGSVPVQVEPVPAQRARARQKYTQSLAEAAATGKRQVSARRWKTLTAQHGLRAGIARGIRSQVSVTKADATVAVRTYPHPRSSPQGRRAARRATAASGATPSSQTALSTGAAGRGSPNASPTRCGGTRRSRPAPRRRRPCHGTSPRRMGGTRRRAHHPRRALKGLGSSNGIADHPRQLCGPLVRLRPQQVDVSGEPAGRAMARPVRHLRVRRGPDHDAPRRVGVPRLGRAAPCRRSPEGVTTREDFEDWYCDDAFDFDLVGFTEADTPAGQAEDDSHLPTTSDGRGPTDETPPAKCGPWNRRCAGRTASTPPPSSRRGNTTSGSRTATS